MSGKFKKRKDRRKADWLFLSVFFICALSATALGIFCLRSAENSFMQEHFYAFVLGYAALMCILFALSVWTLLARKTTLLKSWITLYILLLFVLGMWLLLQKTGFFKVVQSPERLQAYLERAGMWMPIFYILLQFLQVIVLPIPSVVSTVAGVALFGAFWTTLYSLIGIILGSITAFFIGRKLGARAVSWIVGEESLSKWQKKLKGKDNLFLTLMFVLPLFPDDILCFIAGLSTMSTRYFLSMIFVSRLLAITATCYSVDFIPFTTWWGIAIWAAFFIGVIILFIYLYKNMDKLQNAYKRWQNKRKYKTTRK